MIIHCDEGRNASTLAGPFHLVGVLSDRRTGLGTELDDSIAHTIAAALVEHGALQHGIKIVSVRTNREPFETAVRALAFRIPRIAGEVGHAGIVARN